MAKRRRFFSTDDVSDVPEHPIRLLPRSIAVTGGPRIRFGVDGRIPELEILESKSAKCCVSFRGPHGGPLQIWDGTQLQRVSYPHRVSFGIAEDRGVILEVGDKNRVPATTRFLGGTAKVYVFFVISCPDSGRRIILRSPLVEIKPRIKGSVPEIPLPRTAPPITPADQNEAEHLLDARLLPRGLDVMAAVAAAAAEKE